MNIIKQIKEIVFKYAESGREYLSEWYLKVEANFAGIKTWTESHLRGDDGYRHNADDVDYVGDIPQGSTVKEVLEGAYSALKDEVSERKAADDVLRETIDSKAAACEGKYAAIEQSLQEEAEERKAEDNRLQSELAAEKSAREEMDDALMADLEQEKQDRAAGDNAMQSDLNAEIFNRENADSDLRSDIDAEKVEREKADAAILQKLSDAEAARDLLSSLNKECSIIYTILGIEHFDGGLFWDEQNDEPLDGGTFEEEPSGSTDFGDFAVPQIAAQVTANIDGGQFE